MKKLMLLGGMLGFGIGVVFGRLQEASDATILWRSCVAAGAAGLLMRWWGKLWISNLKITLAEQAQRHHQQQQLAAAKTPSSNPR